MRRGPASAPNVNAESDLGQLPEVGRPFIDLDVD